MATVGIRRLVVDCEVPRDHPNPLAAQTRVTEASERLASALGEILSPLAKLGTEVIVIKRLEVAFELDASLDPTELARVWAAQIAKAIAGWLHPEAHTSMLRFPDQAHYLARFLVDSVSGHAQQRWYYRRWHGLAPLSASAQIRTAIVEDPPQGIAALATLSPSELTTVLSALGPREARRIVEVAAETYEAAGTLEAAALAIAPQLAAWQPVAAALASPWQAALALAARASAHAHRDDTRPIVALAAALAATVHARLHPAAAASETALLDAAGLPGPSPLLALTEASRRQLLAPLRAASPETRTTAPASWYTRLGGLLLLLPRIAELRLDELFGADAAAVRLHVLARAAGHSHRDEVLSDPVWRHVCGVAPDADLDAVPLDLEPLADACWRRASDRARRLRAIVTRDRQPLLVIASEPDGDWLSVRTLDRGLRGALRGASIDVDGLELSALATLRTGRAAARMLGWLAPALGSAGELALTLAAQQVLRAFARRLPGFAESSPRFLYDSFLDFDATVLEVGDTFHCRVGRPRLAALYGLTGALRGRLPIGDGRALELYPE